jgi:hypothetical protein
MEDWNCPLATHGRRAAPTAPATPPSVTTAAVALPNLLLPPPPARLLLGFVPQVIPHSPCVPSTVLQIWSWNLRRSRRLAGMPRPAWRTARRCLCSAPACRPGATWAPLGPLQRCGRMGGAEPCHQCVLCGYLFPPCCSFTARWARGGFSGSSWPMESAGITSAAPHGFAAIKRAIYSGPATSFSSLAARQMLPLPLQRAARASCN